MLKKRLLTNQKGLSAIVSTLIIILLVLVAAGVIWVVVKNLIQEGAEGIELGRFTLDLEIKAAQIENGDVTVVVLRRNPGEGNYVGMNFIFSDGTNSEIIRENTTLQELEERSFTFTLTEISTNNLTTISVAPIFELTSGEESVGNIADDFEVTDEMKAGITGDAVGPFADLGFTGAGMKEYTISSQSEEVVKFTKVVVDPLDVLPGDNQTFTAYVSSPNGITNVTTITELDNSTLNLDLELQEDGSWSANWEVYDTHTTTYRTVFTAWDALGNSGSISLTWTDSCQSGITHGTDSTISTTCNTGDSTIAGIDGASLTIAQDTTLTIDANSALIFNQGESITITASGASMVSTSTGSFGNGYLFYSDVDGDNYAPNTVMTYSASPSVAQKIRASSGSLLGTNDCGDGDGNAWTYGYGIDNDGDNYGQSSYGCNNGAAPRTATAGTDCCDTDSRAKPGQLTYFNTSRSGGCAATYDFNCVNGEEKQWTMTDGMCQSCDEICDVECECMEVEPMGDDGWEAVSAPACGAQDDYITDFGGCAYGSACQSVGCEEVLRTQACR